MKQNGFLSLRESQMALIILKNKKTQKKLQLDHRKLFYMELDY